MSTKLRASGFTFTRASSLRYKYDRKWQGTDATLEGKIHKSVTDGKDTAKK